MSMKEIDTDYLVVGAGATAMSFVDTLLTETDARIVMVDRHHRPGGHWNEAYPSSGCTSHRRSTASIRASCRAGPRIRSASTPDFTGWRPD